NILSVNTPGNILKAYPGNLYAIRSEKMYPLLKDLRNYEQTFSCYAFGEYLHLSLKNDGIAVNEELSNYLAQKGYLDIEKKSITPGIEDCFIRLLKQ
ncbi:MAG: ABC transporter ATP-binding protein, partial [Sediminibacterium sp.]